MKKVVDMDKMRDSTLKGGKRMPVLSVPLSPKVADSAMKDIGKK